MQKKKLIVIIIALVLVLAGGASLYNLLGSGNVPETSVVDEQGNAEETESVKAPDFTVYDQDGSSLTLADLEGKPAVINFWASWCGPCKSEMADFNEKYLELGDEVRFVMINLTDGSRETQQTAMEFVNGEGYQFPVYFDLEMSASNSYQAYSIPMTFFIDRDGNAVAQATGAIDAATLQKGIDMIK